MYNTQKLHFINIEEKYCLSEKNIAKLPKKKKKNNTKETRHFQSSYKGSVWLYIELQRNTVKCIQTIVKCDSLLCALYKYVMLSRYKSTDEMDIFMAGIYSKCE